MVKMITGYYKQRKPAINSVKIYLYGVGAIEFFPNGSMHEDKVFSVDFVSRRKIITKILSQKEFVNELVNRNNYKMVFISVNNADEIFVFKALNEVTKVQGVSAPIIEVGGTIMYFPKLRYSDLGLLRVLCDKNMKDYRLLMASGN